MVGVRRLRQKDGKPNPAVRLAFLGTRIPETIRAGFEDIRLRPWIRSPLLCRHCAKHGHTAARCRTRQPRCLQCAGAHPTKDCKSSLRFCPHCCGEHAAWDRSCPYMQEYFRKEAQRLQQLDSRPEDDDHTEGPSTTEANTQTAAEEVLDASTQTTDAARKPTPPPLPPAAERMPEECEDPDLFSQSPLARVAEARQPKNLFFLYKNGKEPRRQPTLLYRCHYSVPVEHLDLRPFSRAYKAATRGFYYDGPQNGERLYLHEAEAEP